MASSTSAAAGGRVSAGPYGPVDTGAHLHCSAEVDRDPASRAEPSPYPPLRPKERLTAIGRHETLAAPPTAGKRHLSDSHVSVGWGFDAWHHRDEDTLVTLDRQPAGGAAAGRRPGPGVHALRSPGVPGRAARAGAGPGRRAA